MTFGADELVRIEGEFLTLSGADVWDRVEDALWLRRQVEHANWSEHGQWWRKTTVGKQTAAASSRKNRARLKTVVVAVAACKGCGKLFERTAYHEQYGRGRVCSSACRGRSRANIELVTLGGESMSLARWAERFGVPLKTVCRRRKLGWSVVAALQTPVRGRAA